MSSNGELPKPRKKDDPRYPYNGFSVGEVDALALNFEWTREEVIAWLAAGNKPRRCSMVSFG